MKIDKSTNEIDRFIHRYYKNNKVTLFHGLFIKPYNISLKTTILGYFNNNYTIGIGYFYHDQRKGFWLRKKVYL